MPAVAALQAKRPGKMIGKSEDNVKMVCLTIGINVLVKSIY